MHNGHGGGQSYSRSYNPGAGGVVTHQPITKKTSTSYNPPPSSGGGGGPPSILNRPPTIPKGRTTTGGITGSNKFKKFTKKNWSNFGTGKHFGVEGNRQKLLDAYNRGLITERQYKLMSGYDASQEIGLLPLSTFLSSGIYNIGKKILHPEDFKGKIGAWESTLLNTMGSKGQGFDKNQYSGITELSPESLQPDPYASSLDAQTAQKIGYAPSYDFADGGIVDLYRYGGF
jgi:hypothetical protein